VFVKILHLEIFGHKQLFSIQDQIKELVEQIKVPPVTKRNLTAQERDALRERKDMESQLLEKRRQNLETCVCCNGGFF
jgi:hypothetical protein